MSSTYARTIVVLLFALALVAPAAAQEAAPQPAIDRNFLETLKEDVKSAISTESLTVLSTAAALALLAQPFDETLTYSASCSTFLKTTFEGWARVVGQEWVLGGGALATYAIGRVSGDPKLAAVGGDLVEAQLLAGTTSFTLKHAIRRPRPDGEARSFPSGHAAGGFAAATVIQRHYGIKGAVPAFAAAVLISGARLQANSHYATDVILGAALGVIAGRAATFDLGGRHVLLAPAVTGGGLLVSGSIR
jgi:membrane-associated phospholipid phosphatase